MKRTKLVLVLLLILAMPLLAGCGKVSEEPEAEEPSATEILVDEMAQKYGALANWPSDYDFTFQLQDKLLNQSIVFTASVDDIWRDGGKQYVSLSDWWSDYRFILEFTGNKLFDVVSQFEENDCFFSDVVGVARISEISKPTLSISGYPISEEEVELEYDTSDTLIFRGQLIDIEADACGSILD